jgi:hypothetical protein
VKRFGLIVGLLAAVACTPQPQARLVAVSDVKMESAQTTVMVLVDIENPTGETLMLSGFDYEVEAREWFTARGSYALSRYLVPGDVATIEVPLPAKTLEVALGVGTQAWDGINFELRGTIRALAGAGEKSWEVQQQGRLEPIVKIKGYRRHSHEGQIRVHLGG